jgi:hypothetical protein
MMKAVALSFLGLFSFGTAWQADSCRDNTAAMQAREQSLNLVVIDASIIAVKRDGEILHHRLLPNGDVVVAVIYDEQGCSVTLRFTVSLGGRVAESKTTACSVSKS